MDKLRNYDISFSGLKNGKHSFQFRIEQAFFDLFGIEQEFTSPRITADVLMEKHTTFLELDIRTEGTVTLVCDISSKEFEHPVENEIKILVKFGEEYDDSNEDIITIPSTDHAFNVAQLIYEDVVLSIPMKKVAPDVDNEILDALDRYSPQADEEKED